jgi:hypothetical protein
MEVTGKNRGEVDLQPGVDEMPGDELNRCRRADCIYTPNTSSGPSLCRLARSSRKIDSAGRPERNWYKPNTGS